MGRKYLITILLFAMSVFSTSCSKEQNAAPPPERSAEERSVKQDVYLESENVGGLRESELLQKIRNYELKVNIQANDAKFDTVTWDVTEADKAGRHINVQKTLENLLNAAEGSRQKLVIEKDKARVSAQQVKERIVLIGRYTTPIKDRQEARVNNIKIGAGKLNYQKVEPGEEFSFNDALGRRTEAKGYEEAPIIIKTEDGFKKEKGVGGGICQLATTLYNATATAGLEITERHEHSRDVSYAPDGKDAAVSYGTMDFKFRNNRNYPIMIRTYLTKKSITVKIFENRN